LCRECIPFLTQTTGSVCAMVELNLLVSVAVPIQERDLQGIFYSNIHFCALAGVPFYHCVIKMTRELLH
jgi:hypothetical protein